MDRLVQLLYRCESGNVDDIVMVVQYVKLLIPDLDARMVVRAALSVARANNPEAMSRSCAYKLFREE